MKSIRQLADEYAVQNCREMYSEDNETMRSVAAIIAMNAITFYLKEWNRLRGLQKKDSQKRFGLQPSNNSGERK